MLCVALGAIGTTGCAIAPTDPMAQREEPVYVTGSNIARRHAATPPGEVKSMSGEEFERLRFPQLPLPTPGGSH